MKPDKKNDQRRVTYDEEEPNIEEDVPKYKKTVHRMLWPTRSIAIELGREEELRVTLRETIIYLFFVAFVTIYAIGSRSAYMFYLTKALRDQFFEREFEGIDGIEMSFNDIKTVGDFWNYAEGLLLASFYWEFFYDETNQVKETSEDDKKILYENKILGVPRMRQLRVRNDSCIVHTYFRRLFLTCYDLYTQDSKDTQPFGLGEGTAWEYSEPSETKSTSFRGKVSHYDGGGYYVDFASDKNGTAKTIGDLKNNLWITRHTRAIFIDFSIYNANLNLFAVCSMLFEFPPTGGVIPSFQFHALKLLTFLYMTDYIIFVFECFFYIFILYYILEAGSEFLYFKETYFLKFWSYVDLLIICFAIASSVLTFIVWIRVPVALKLIENHPDKYGNLERVADLQMEYRHLVSVTVFFVYLKIFKYLSFNRNMGQLNSTLSKCAVDILGFSIMFFIIFFAFAELGYLLFGSQVQNFSTFGQAMFTLLRTILGDFDYDEIEQANRILAPIYFLSYIFLVFFVLLNMFLAIINDTYADVKTEIAIAPEEMQMSEYIKDGFLNFLRRLGCRIKIAPKEVQDFNVSLQQVKNALKKCGFSDLEIAMFFARYNIDPTAKVAEQNTAKLMEDLKAAQPGGPGADGGFVGLNDFKEQQNRLEEIEGKIDVLSMRIQQLLKKLETIEAAKKKK